MLPQFRQGIPAALSHIYGKYFLIIYLFTKQIVKDQFEAEDITIIAIQKLLSSSEKFQTEINVRSFLFKTARNASLDFLRSQKRKKQFQISYKAQMPKEEMPKEFEDYSQAEMKTKEIDELPNRLKHTIKLVQMGYSSQEIADELKVSLKTARNYRAEASRLLGLNKK